MITYTEDGHEETIEAGHTTDALSYEVLDMERAIDGDDQMHLDYTIDVMQMMTKIRQDWHLTYPEEE